jgi:hypothetical protein
MAAKDRCNGVEAIEAHLAQWSPLERAAQSITAKSLVSGTVSDFISSPHAFAFNVFVRAFSVSSRPLRLPHAQKY